MFTHQTKKYPFKKKIRANEVLKKFEISILYAYTSPHHKKNSYTKQKNPRKKSKTTKNQKLFPY